MKEIIQLEGHRLANYFPAIENEEFDELVEDIKKNGQINPIIMYEGKILDGKNRYRVCQKLGIEPITKEYDGDDPVGFVISINIHRRHLTESQRAMLATKMLPELEKQSKEKERVRLSEKAKKQNAGSKGFKPLSSVEGSQNPSTLKTTNGRVTHKAGEMFGVSGSTVQKAKRILKAVDEGELEKETIDNIIAGKESVGTVDKALGAKHFVKREKEREAKEGKKLPNQYPKAVKEYIDFLKNGKDRIKLATRLAKEGMFSPEALQFIKRLHEQVKSLMDEMEEVK